MDGRDRRRITRGRSFGRSGGLQTLPPLIVSSPLAQRESRKYPLSSLRTTKCFSRPVDVPAVRKKFQLLDGSLGQCDGTLLYASSRWPWRRICRRVSALGTLQSRMGFEYSFSDSRLGAMKSAAALDLREERKEPDIRRHGLARAARRPFAPQSHGMREAQIPRIDARGGHNLHHEQTNEIIGKEAYPQLLHDPLADAIQPNTSVPSVVLILRRSSSMVQR